VAARAGFKNTTLQSKGFHSTNAPPHPKSRQELIIIIIKLSFIECLNKKNLAQKCLTEESKAIIKETKLNAAASQSGAIEYNIYKPFVNRDLCPNGKHLAG